MPPTNTPTRETKTLHFQIKATGTSVNARGQQVGKIEAYTAMYNNVDEGNDRILPGAFKRTAHNAKSRAKNRNKEYLFPMLWNHDDKHFMPLGGWYDLDPDNAEGLLCKGDVLLTTQVGHDYYELALAGMTDLFSIIYDIPSGGAKYDKSGVRDLSEIRLFSLDPVVFAMNDETYMVGVKSMDIEGLEYKSACGNTSGPIGPRNEGWDGAAAKKWIWGKALDSDGKVKASVAKKYFMRCDGDASEKGSYSYPFWTNDHISVGGVKAVAGALGGARDADAEGDTAAMKRKVETLYGRINSKYPDAEKLTPRWKDDGKSDERDMQHKDFNAHYVEEMAEDLWSDLSQVYFCALCCAIRDAFMIGDEPAVDVSEAIAQFETRMMEWVERAESVDLSGYLQEDSDDGDDYAIPSYYYSSMGRAHMPDFKTHTERLRSRKAGRAISAASQAVIDTHVASLHDRADQMLSDMKSHVKAIHTQADDFATVIQGSEPTYADPNAGTPEDGQQEGKGKAGVGYLDMAGKWHEVSDIPSQVLEKALADIKSLRK